MKNPTEPAAPRRGKPKRSAEAKETGGTLKIRLVRSGICTPRDQKLTLKALGLTRREQEVVRADHPAIRGMIHKVRHLVEVDSRSER
ncbi:MAG: 50S ribosomal protein L30 [Thermoanaerobaculia bacterium]|nr:50S ribosomal protein L30 [Thermoanaerobaculia bacterium]